MQHRLRKRSRLCSAQAPDPCRHQPCGYLVIGNFAARIPRNQKLDFFAGMFAGVAFFSDQVASAHAVGCVRGSVTSSHLQVNAPSYAALVALRQLTNTYVKCSFRRMAIRESTPAPLLTE